MPSLRHPSRLTRPLHLPRPSSVGLASCAVTVALLAGCAEAPSTRAPAGAPVPAPASAPASAAAAAAPLQPASSPTLPTVADTELRAKVLESIAVFESAAGRGDAPRLIAVESLGSIDDTWIERWTVRSGGRRVGYSVKFKRAAGTDVDFSVEQLVDATRP